MEFSSSLKPFAELITKIMVDVNFSQPAVVATWPKDTENPSAWRRNTITQFTSLIDMLPIAETDINTAAIEQLLPHSEEDPLTKFNNAIKTFKQNLPSRQNFPPLTPWKTVAQMWILTNCLNFAKTTEFCTNGMRLPLETQPYSEIFGDKLKEVLEAEAKSLRQAEAFQAVTETYRLYKAGKVDQFPNGLSNLPDIIQDVWEPDPYAEYFTIEITGHEAYPSKFERVYQLNSESLKERNN